MTDVLRFTMHRPIASKKNGRRFGRSRGRIKLLPSDKARTDEQTLRMLALHAASAQGWRLVEDDDVEVRLVYRYADEEVDVEVRRIRPRPDGRSGRARDLHGMFEALADALQGVAYRNDNQVARVEMARKGGDGCDSGN